MCDVILYSTIKCSSCKEVCKKNYHRDGKINITNAMYESVCFRGAGKEVLFKQPSELIQESMFHLPFLMLSVESL